MDGLDGSAAVGDGPALSVHLLGREIDWFHGGAIAGEHVKPSNEIQIAMRPGKPRALAGPPERRRRI